ncbi:DMT family transporter [Alphaproteobacteria bacterium]|nr:DMT family transporter [Alphaproteobacteria bacterium]
MLNFIKNKINIKLSSTLLGTLLLIATYLFFSVMELTAKELGRSFNTFQIVFARYLSQLIILIVIFNKKTNLHLHSKFPFLQILRGALLLITTCFMFSGLVFLPFAENIAIYMIGPVITTILAFFILNEKISFVQIIIVIVGLIGAIIIANPNNYSFNYAVVFPFMAAICFAFFTISTKFLNNSDTNQTTLLYTAISGTVLSLPFIIFYWKQPNIFDVSLMICLGLLATIGHFLFIEALKVINASFAAPFVYLTVLMAAFWGYIIYDEIPNKNTILGAFLIIIAGIIITQFKKK